MKCLIPGTNVKVLARAVHALAKIGDELYVDPLPGMVSFRTVNSSRSAYASFTFDASFFLQYIDGDNTATGDDEDVKCKISMRSCIAVFKSPNTIDKHVETCQFKLEPDDKKLIFQFRCRYGIVKTHYLPIIECETLQAVYTKEMAPNVLIAEPKLFIDALHNFQINEEELTLAVTPVKITLRNFTDFEPEPHKGIRTELCLESGEFVKYSVRSESSITFCLKELRALLSFAESVSLPIAINFEHAGRPVVFVISHPHTFEANFVLATLMPRSDTQEILTPEPDSNLSKKRAPSVNDTAEKLQDPKKSRGDSAENNLVRPAPVSKGNSKGYITKTKTSNMGKEKQNSNVSNMNSLDNLEEVFEMEWENVNDVEENRKEASCSVDKTIKNKSVMLDKNNSEEHVQKQLEASSVDSGSRGLMDYSEQIDSEITCLATPSVSGVSMVYRRCFQDTFNPAHLPGYDEVLAPDTDEEPD